MRHRRCWNHSGYFLLSINRSCWIFWKYIPLLRKMIPFRLSLYVPFPYEWSLHLPGRRWKVFSFIKILIHNVSKRPRNTLTLRKCKYMYSIIFVMLFSWILSETFPWFSVSDFNKLYTTGKDLVQFHKKN